MWSIVNVDPFKTPDDESANILSVSIKKTTSYKSVLELFTMTRGQTTNHQQEQTRCSISAPIPQTELVISRVRRRTQHLRIARSALKVKLVEEHAQACNLRRHHLEPRSHHSAHR